LAWIGFRGAGQNDIAADKASNDPSFDETFSGIFHGFEQRDYGPQWKPFARKKRWAPHSKAFGPASAVLMKCARGPIEAVELRASTVVTDSDDTSATEWRTDTEVCFPVRPDWLRNWLPGFHRWAANLGADGYWTWNDVGLGIIEQLNNLPRPEEYDRATRIEVRNTDSDDHLTLHSVTNHQIEIVHGCGSTEVYGERDAVPRLSWRIPSKRSVQRVVSTAQLLAADPQYLPSQTRPPRVSAIPAKSIVYVRWTLIPIVAIALLTVGLGSIYWATQRSGAGMGWVLFFGIVLSIIGAIGGFIGLDRLSQIRRGCLLLVGILDRKWVGPDHDFIRVEGLPFAVNGSHHRMLSEGDSVSVTYWPDDKRVESIERATESNAPARR
jgi:hypothetical protein